MKYKDKIIKELETLGEDIHLIDQFINSNIYYINNELILEFSLYEFYQDLYLNNNTDKSIHELSHFFNNNLTLKGCITFLDSYEEKRLFFNSIRLLLKDYFCEFDSLNDLEILIRDNTKIALASEIKNKNKKIKVYLSQVLKELHLDQLNDIDQIFEETSGYIIEKLKLDTLTAKELVKFDIKKANKKVILKQVDYFISTKFDL